MSIEIWDSHIFHVYDMLVSKMDPTMPCLRVEQKPKLSKCVGVQLSCGLHKMTTEPDGLLIMCEHADGFCH
jgi:hypothetical protein